MIKIIFEISEDFVKTGADPQKVAEKNAEGGGKKSNPIKDLFNFMAFTLFEKEIDKGKKEFIVKKENLDGSSKDLYDNMIGEAMMVAVKSVPETSEAETEEAHKPENNEE